MDFPSIGFPKFPSVASELQADPSMLTQLSFEAGLSERMTSFTDDWSVNNMRPMLISCNCHEMQGFKIPARVELGGAHHNVDRIQLQDNNSSTSSEQTVPNRNSGSKRKACKDLTNTSLVKKSKGDENTAKCLIMHNASKKMSSKSSEHDSANLSPNDSVLRYSPKDPKESSTKLQEPPKDYIHVRARRGQATDSHSLAERVRREKISERMKFLQSLVPGCSKVTGKAVMLDEIINYVQSLQRQVELLSLKLAVVDPSNMENLLNQELAAQATRSPQTTLLGPDPLASYQDYQLHMQIQPQIKDHCNMDWRSYLGRSTNELVQLPPQMAYTDNFVGSLPQTGLFQSRSQWQATLPEIEQNSSSLSRSELYIPRVPEGGILNKLGALYHELPFTCTDHQTVQGYQFEVVRNVHTHVP